MLASRQTHPLTDGPVCTRDFHRRYCVPDIHLACNVVQVKKTVYIGSFDTEVGAAAAVDAWHVSQGREAVNFPEPSLVPRQSADSADTHSDSDAVAEADESPQQNDNLSNAEEPAQLHSSPAKDHLHHAASLLNSLRPQAHSESAQVSNGVRRSHFSAHHGHGGGKSQRQSAAGALVAKAAGRSKASKDSSHQGRHAFWRPRSVPTQGCTGVSYANGKWRAQIRVDNVVQYLGRFQHKEDAAEAYKQAAMQRLVRQGASH